MATFCLYLFIELFVFVCDVQLFRRPYVKETLKRVYAMEKLGLAQKGKKFSQEHKNNMSEAKKGKKRGPYKKK